MHIQARNLLHWVKKECINTQTMNKFLLANPSTERRIGALPVEWIKDIPKAERGSITQKINEAFEHFSVNTAKIKGRNYQDGYPGCAEDFLPEQSKLLDLLMNILPTPFHENLIDFGNSFLSYRKEFSPNQWNLSFKYQ